MPRLVVDRRFHGPPGSANGGYFAGRVAQLAGTLTGAAVPFQVTLRKPPPLETPLRVVPAGEGRVEIRHGDQLVAEAEPATLDVAPVPPVTFAEAETAAKGYAGFTAHPFPGCFTCGPERAAGDGLRIFPGPLGDRPDTTACPWVPDPSLSEDGRTVLPEFVWAALDCPGGWTVDLGGRPMVLGRITAQMDALPTVGDQCVVLGRLLGQEGRKAFSVTTLYDGAGRELARARAVWITVDPARITR